MQESLTREFQLTIREYFEGKVLVKVFLGDDFKSEQSIIQSVEMGLSNQGIYKLGFGLVLYGAEGNAFLLGKNFIEIYVGEYKITYNTNWIKYSLDYIGSLDSYELNIPIAECEIRKMERKEDEKYGN